MTPSPPPAPSEPAAPAAVPSPGEALHGYGRALANLLYPPACLICQRPLLEEERHACLHCRATLTPALPWRCGLCGTRQAGEEPEPGRRCRLCPPAEAPWRGAWALTGYFAESARAVHLFKYGRRLELGRLIARLTAEGLAPDLIAMGQRVELIVPVPLHWTRRLVRGFNQSQLIAEAISAATRLPLMPGILRRRKYTRRQALVPHDRREQNVRNAFRMGRRADVRGKGILLIDDVVTTGHTISECARVMKDNGAREVWVACFARAGVWKPEGEEGD